MSCCGLTCLLDIELLVPAFTVIKRCDNDMSRPSKISHSACAGMSAQQVHSWTSYMQLLPVHTLYPYFNLALLEKLDRTMHSYAMNVASSQVMWRPDLHGTDVLVVCSRAIAAAPQPSEQAAQPLHTIPKSAGTSACACKQSRAVAERSSAVDTLQH